ncbi:uncharacterized protein LOC143174878 isoform X2 [Nomia melanderi]|uniref:uncharacterized protein LOC143174878 isoform X2 n=1 Tax=Nomia melanderi TaxID=2448451 RepID=UPI003FCDF875
MDDLKDHHYTLYRIILSIVGLWPYDNSWSAYVKRVLGLLIFVSASLFQIIEIYYMEEYNTSLILEFISNGCIIIFCLVKYCTFLLKINEVKYIIEMIRNHWRSITDKVEMEILMKHADRGKELGILFGVCLYLIIISYALYLPFIPAYNASMEESKYIVNSHAKLRYTFDDDKYSSVALLHTDIWFFCATTVIIGTDLTIFICIFHVYGTLQLYSYRLTNIFNNEGSYTSDLKKCRSMYKEIGKAVEISAEIIRFGDTVQKNYLRVYFLLLILGMASVSVNLLRFLHAILQLQMMSQIIPQAAAVIGHLLYVCALNYLGQYVKDGFVAVEFKTFECTWYTAPIGAQKMLILIICGMQRGWTPVLGGFYHPCNEGLFAANKVLLPHKKRINELNVSLCQNRTASTLWRRSGIVTLDCTGLNIT